MGLVKARMRQQSRLVRGLRVTGLIIMGVLLFLAKLPEALEDWSLDHGQPVAVSAQITRVDARAGIDAPARQEAVYFDYPMPDGNVGHGRNLAPIRRFRQGQTALVDVLPARPQVVRLRGAQCSAQGSAILLLVPAFLVLLPVGWWASFWVVFREEKWWLHHAHWLEAKVVYEPEGKASRPESYGYDCRGSEVEAHYDFEGRSEIYTMNLSPTEAEALAAQGRMALLVLPMGRELGDGRTMRRVTRPEWCLRA